MNVKFFASNSHNYLLSFFLLHAAYEGDYCENDVDGCEEVSCFNNATCTDVPAPGTGATCPPCPTGFTGDGFSCTGQFPLPIISV